LERTLVEAGETEAVDGIRRAFQRAMRERFVTVVEEATGRHVRAFLSEVSLEPDISAEIFVLERVEPDPNPAPEGVG
ncbi:MAG TPA: Na-translocating system protein MpsC family protein, partial [Gaiellaceae bacterium]|nr:Na-translocating system protein MpsC family protein [Gaiellaceae bacterium]